MRSDGSSFTDRDIHKYLKDRELSNPKGEWFRCKLNDIRKALIALRFNKDNYEGKIYDFKMRPEQENAVEKTKNYFQRFKVDNNKLSPKFLWNAKMRFGKTFTAYQLIKRLSLKKILILTFKPAVESAWENDLTNHIDFDGWQFFNSKNDIDFKIKNNMPTVIFGSFQDYMGRNKQGGLKKKNEWVHSTHWDLVIFDEYHYGAWREGAKELFESEDNEEQIFLKGDGIDNYDENIIPITTDFYLYLSGTPFRAIQSGEFIEEQIYNWTYSDEQKAKLNYKKIPNLYDSLPEMILMTYQLPEDINNIASEGEFDSFNLNEFFLATGKLNKAIFKYPNEVQKWLNLIRGAHLETSIDNLKLGAKKPPMPFSDKRLLNLLNHTIWFLPSVASCHAMYNLINEQQNIFYEDYDIIVAAGPEAGIGVDALKPVLDIMHEPLNSKSITLTCGKLTTGVTVKPWSGIFMLRNLNSPETYFQAAFRVQSPWVVINEDNKSPNKEIVVKEKCYIFDFAPERALKQIADYSCRLDASESNPEDKVKEFINFLPVLAYDGSTMIKIDAGGILDIAIRGTSSTLLARKWESALLVNVDNSTLENILNHDKALEILMSIEGFRSLNNDIVTIINHTDNIKDIKEKEFESKLDKNDKKELSDIEKEIKSKRREIQKKLIKFSTRIPIFMYLTDYRERSLKDIILQLEPNLFKKVTGISVNDFEILLSLNVFNSTLMNDAIYKFKRYEDSSLNYSGINKHSGEDVGLYDTVLTEEIYTELSQ